MSEPLPLQILEKHNAFPNPQIVQIVAFIIMYSQVKYSTYNCFHSPKRCVRMQCEKLLAPMTP